jgi:uncharacterized membrane protein
LEEFIGTNLLNKAGIGVLVIGLGFGAKYSIDHALLSASIRILLGYLSGTVMIALALRLKKQHENFSAVLLSGGMAVLYFMTYAAYDFYDLIPQTVALAIMVVLTASTVLAALTYNKEVIGIIGLTGGYAVPFLLSDGSGRVMILFSYITIINTGILVLAVKRYWKGLYYTAFILTWIIFASWHIFQYEPSSHFWISLGFSTIFFTIFLGTCLSYKLGRKEPLGIPDVVLMLSNSFIYFAYGYITIDSLESNEMFLTLFALFTALLHFIACIVIKKQQTIFKDIFFLVAGMVVVFLTLAIPISLEGNWVTVLWSTEAALLFWIGRVKQYPVYEKLSYPLMALSIVSLFHDWNNTYRSIDYFVYNYSTTVTLFLNVQFLTTLFVIACLAFCLWLGRQTEYPPAFHQDSDVEKALTFGLPLIIIFILYMGIYKEIDTFWIQRYADSEIRTGDGHRDSIFNADLLNFKTLWLINYSAIFAITLAAVNAVRLKNYFIGVISMVSNALVIFVFLTLGLEALNELRGNYLNDFFDPYFSSGLGNILIRYVSLALFVGLMIITHREMRKEIFSATVRQTGKVLMMTAGLILLSSELIHWLEIGGVDRTHDLPLTILWGAYALLLVVLGLRKDLAYMRITAIVLFGVTLAKLFVYDMKGMSTISRTIVMIVLGVLLLTASFLYNKFKRAPGTDV